MYCPTCGQQHHPTDRFCVRCGTALVTSHAANDTPVTPNTTLFGFGRPVYLPEPIRMIYQMLARIIQLYRLMRGAMAGLVSLVIFIIFLLVLYNLGLLGR